MGITFYIFLLLETLLLFLKAFHASALITYGITGIPVNYLVDANGNILAKNIGPEKLEQTLASIFKE
jgi:hypothetical protein